MGQTLTVAEAPQGASVCQKEPDEDTLTESVDSVEDDEHEELAVSSEAKPPVAPTKEALARSTEKVFASIELVPKMSDAEYIEYVKNKIRQQPPQQISPPFFIPRIPPSFTISPPPEEEHGTKSDPGTPAKASPKERTTKSEPGTPVKTAEPVTPPEPTTVSGPATPTKGRNNGVATKLVLRGVCADLIDKLREFSAKGPDTRSEELIGMCNRLAQFREHCYDPRAASYEVVCIWEEIDDQGQWRVVAVHGTKYQVMQSVLQVLASKSGKGVRENFTRVRLLPQDQWSNKNDPVASARAARKALVVSK